MPGLARRRQQYPIGILMSSSVVSSRTSLVVLRGLVWAIIGLIYAPLFTALFVLFQAMGLGHGSFAPAAAIAGAVGAAFYSAREVALVGTVIGLGMATLLFMVLPGTVALWQVVLVAGLAGGLLGRLLRFPDQCALQAPGKAMAGLVSGLTCGALLGFVESLHTVTFNLTAIVAFLVSVNGTFYAATVGWWLGQARVKQGAPCKIIERLVIGLVAAVVAASLWVFAGPLIGAVDGSYYALLHSILTLLPGALFGGFVAGAITGALLQAFDFDWLI
jgi:hypothetical protein